MVSIQFSHTSPSKCICSSPSGNLMSCSFLIPWLCSLSCLPCGDVICGISCLCSFNCFSCGNVICSIVVVCLTAYTTVGITDGSILPLIIFCAFKSMLSYSFFTLEREAPPSSSLFFLLIALFGESAAVFFILSSVFCISSLVLLTLAGVFYGLSFLCINKY